MTSETQPQEASTTTAPDFSDYQWFAGVKDRFDSVGVVERRDGDGVDLLMRGYARKKGQGLGHGTIRAHFDFEAIEALRDHLSAILGAA